MKMMIDTLVVRFVNLGPDQYLRLAEDRWYANLGDSFGKTGPALTEHLETMYKAQTEAGYEE